MPAFWVSRYFGGRHCVTPFDAPTAGEAVELAMAEDGVSYEVHRDGRPEQTYELTPNGLRGKLSEAGDMSRSDGLGT